MRTTPEHPDSQRTYNNSSQQTLLAILRVLIAFPLRTFPLDELARDTGRSRDQIFRAIWNLEHQGGWIERSEEGVRLSPSFTRASEKVRESLATLHHLYLGAA